MKIEKIILLANFLISSLLVYAQGSAIDTSLVQFPFSSNTYTWPFSSLTIEVKGYKHYIFRDSVNIYSIGVDSLDQVKSFGQYDINLTDTLYLITTHPISLKEDTIRFFIFKAIKKGTWLYIEQ